jgi:hypothetical protein
MLRKLRRLSDLSFGELLVFFQLSLFAFTARVLLEFLSLPRLVSLLSVSAANPLLKRFPLFHDSQDWSRLLLIADWSARAIRSEGPCLLRSLLLLWLLKARGDHAELLIGVCIGMSELNSHAWIESRGAVIGDSMAMTERFATLLRF